MRKMSGRFGAAAGMTALTGMMLAAAIASAQTHSTVYTFTGGSDGAYPYAGLIGDNQGNFYGTAPYDNVTGGPCPSFACGVIFELDSQGEETVLYSFTGTSDGGGPFGGLIRDNAGNLFGTTAGGGNLPCDSSGLATGCGVVFWLDPNGWETVLHRFTGKADGASPLAGLISDGAHNFYGTTTLGGDLACGDGFGCGVVFKIGANGKETVMHSFTGATDGVDPEAPLVRDAAGNLYGTTRLGGSESVACGGNGCGVVFKIDPTGNESVLFSFTGGADGGAPVAGLILDASGNLYGTTTLGGSRNGGVVFEINPEGQETVLYNFTGGADGGQPWAGLIRDGAGNLYGTTFGGGDLTCGFESGCGVVFKLNPATGTETALYTFTGAADGGYPVAGLLPYQGALYGNTQYGGAKAGTNGFGVVFKITLP
jgi:uncharacterized repeat protein (TIGR03803 family)